jgi:hypothetical protein
MFDADQLFVLWSEPAQGSRCVIGDLWREGKGGPFLFRYRSAVAGLDGFVPLPEFPNLEGVYRSAYLHGTFSQRLPSPQRPDYVSLIQGWGVQHPDDVFEVLARSGGVQMTDRIELAEFRSDRGRFGSAARISSCGNEARPRLGERRSWNSASARA